MASRAETLSLLIPVYNEAESFPTLVTQIERHVPPPFQAYVVYDFEEDTTVPLARELAASRPWLRVLRNDLGRGVVNALRVGFRAIGSGPTLVVMADLSDDLSLVPALLERYRAGFGIVCPSRYVRGGHQEGGGLLKSTLSRLAGLSLHALAGFPTHDATNNFRLYDAALVNGMGIESTGAFEVALELTAKAFRRGVPIAELPASWRDRTTGQSSFRLRALLPRYLRWYGHVLATAWLHRREEAGRAGGGSG